MEKYFGLGQYNPRDLGFLFDAAVQRAKSQYSPMVQGMWQSPDFNTMTGQYAMGQATGGIPNWADYLNQQFRF